MQKITPFLWFKNEAEDAARFYASVFKGGKITSTSHYPKDSPGPEGQVMTVGFNILGMDFVALNGGEVDQFHFTPAISFVINCESQEETDYYWEKLSSGGKTSQCGWLTDKYGIAWQVVPTRLEELLLDPDKDKAYKVMQAMLKMTKIEIEDLEAAADAK